MKKPRIMFDKTEVVAYATIVNDLNKKSRKLLNLTYDKFTKISVVKCTEKKLFRMLDSEKIVLNITGFARPIEFTKKDNEQFFDGYKASFKKFASVRKVPKLSCIE